jgi:hypothetical protein
MTGLAEARSFDLRNERGNLHSTNVIKNTIDDHFSILLELR